MGIEKLVANGLIHDCFVVEPKIGAVEFQDKFFPITKEGVKAINAYMKKDQAPSFQITPQKRGGVYTNSPRWGGD